MFYRSLKSVHNLKTSNCALKYILHKIQYKILSAEIQISKTFSSLLPFFPYISLTPPPTLLYTFQPRCPPHCPAPHREKGLPSMVVLPSYQHCHFSYGKPHVSEVALVRWEFERHSGFRNATWILFWQMLLSYCSKFFYLKYNSREKSKLKRTQSKAVRVCRCFCGQEENGLKFNKKEFLSFS